jgi:hypothetical protein
MLLPLLRHRDDDDGDVYCEQIRHLLLRGCLLQRPP